MDVKTFSDGYQSRLIGYPIKQPSNRVKRSIRDRVAPFNLERLTDGNARIELPLPEWYEGAEAEVLKAATAIAGPWMDRLDRFCDRTDWRACTLSVPPIRPGWQKLNEDTWEPAEPPSDCNMVLDFETVRVGTRWLPSCAAALSNKGIYVWQADVSLGLPTETVVPFATGNLIVGHNVQYDRAFLDVEYRMDDSKNRFLDTMSAWIRVRGQCNQQRVTYALYADEGEDVAGPEWIDETATNGLDAVYEFYTGQPMSKGVRDELMGAYRRDEKILKNMPEANPAHMWEWTKANFQRLIMYCLRDVYGTFEVFRHVYPELKRAQPSPASFAGQLELGTAWLPLSSDRWPGYYDRCEAAYRRTKKEVSTLIRSCLEELYREHGAPLRDLLKPIKPKDRKEANPDWTSAIAGYVAELPDHLKHLDWKPGESGVSKGQPAWYRKASGKGSNLTIHSRLTPILLGMTWCGEPLLWSEEQGWHTAIAGMLPHPDKKGKRVTDVFTKGFIAATEDGVLSQSHGEPGLLAKAMSCINWISMRKRIASVHVESPEGYPVTLPQLVVTGTVTGRATDQVWQVCANPKKSRIGTELKSMVQAPAGYKIVGFDVDAEEARICGLYGDAQHGYVGSTPLSLINLLGTKKDKTELHWTVALQAGVDRDAVAKPFNYGVIYGLGLKGATDILVKALPRDTEDRCRQMAQELITMFKGSKARDQVYYDGLASDSFNMMEGLADDRSPRTPLLGARMSMALAGNKDFKTTRVNWTIQATGVDFRDLLICLTLYYFQRFGVTGRLLMTIHDEARFLVRDGDEVMAAYACQLAHVTTWVLLITNLGLNAIPVGIAWASGVDVDHVLRKDPEAPCTTPTQPDPIAPGFTWTPDDIMKQLSELA